MRSSAMKWAAVCLAAWAMVAVRPASALTTDQLEELFFWCNTSMPTPNPAAHAFLGGLQYLEIPNADIAYYRFGNNETGRPALMLVNGLNSVMGGWPLRLLRALAEEQEVVIFDNRGQGLSVDTNSTAPLTVQSMAEDVKNLAVALGFETPPNLMGVSMGGMITITAAALHGDTFNRFIPISGSAGGNSSLGFSEKMMHSLTHLAQMDLYDLMDMYFPMPHPLGLLTACWYTMEAFDRPMIPTNATTTARQMEAILDFFQDDQVYDLLPSINSRVLVVGGALDPVIRPQNQKLMAKRLPAAWMTMFPEGGHATYVEYWSTLVDVLNVFLGRDADEL
ncbi:Putative aminoacrylate hydrolase RutD [Auxenochlorella protothecoides]|uniref:Putative aminoacrylate hydrolase RutD n=1 Tax=Auxenochlorella protothecoides TaxID=3075 RepID=A0A087SE11_AUXPR|nr:Putative aminoacrylate hydrolase RutD [Auxenochlorella protothecoides]KFM23965.1 Putative aminoacrylate hydrolase RutD [Auxenochlorella protothecoides]